MIVASFFAKLCPHDEKLEKKPGKRQVTEKLRSRAQIFEI